MKKHVSMHEVLGRLRALLDAPVLPAPARRTIGEGVQELEAAAAAIEAALVDAEAAIKAAQVHKWPFKRKHRPMRTAIGCFRVRRSAGFMVKVVGLSPAMRASKEWCQQ